jgi:hypothetical protein
VLDLGEQAQSRVEQGLEDTSSKLTIIGLAILVALMLGLFVVLVPIIAVEHLLGGAGGSGTTTIGPGSPIPADLVPVFNEAGAVLDVNPYLLASVAYQESSFGAPDSRVPNSAGCVGFMQTCIGGAGGDSWDSTVTLTAHPKMTLAQRFAYKLGSRPSGYPGETANHPNYNDPYDGVMTGAVELRSKVGGRPIPQLDQTAYQALCGYYGACADGVAGPYAQDVLDRAQRWQAESALDGSPTVTLTPGETARILSNGNATAPSGAPKAVKLAIAAANQIHSKPYPEPVATHYDGNLAHPWPAYDCSGAVSYVLYKAGLHSQSADDSGSLESWGQPGPGKWITVYANGTHTFIVIAGRAFDTADFGGPNIPAGSGPRWRQDPTGNKGDGLHYTPRHPPGL